MTNVQRSRRQVRLSRALGIALTPKAQRIFEKRPYAPGEHGRTRRRTESDYAVRLREKQRLRAQYGISEKQLRAAYEKGTHTAGQTGNAMLTDLETRLDALVLRAGFARTTAQARQFVVHRHILVDGNIVDRPSYRVKPGQTIQVKAKSQTMVPFQAAAEGVHRDVLPAVPGYLDVNLPSLKATLTRKPEAEEIPVQVNIQYVVEFYARCSGSPYCKNIQFKDIQRKPRSRYGCEASRFLWRFRRHVVWLIPQVPWKPCCFIFIWSVTDRRFSTDITDSRDGRIPR